MKYWNLFWPKGLFSSQQTPTKERLVDLENYANFHGLRCVLDVNFTGINEHTIRGNPKKIKKHIKKVMNVEFNKISNQEADLIYNAWVEAVQGYRTDIILIEKYDREI